MRSRCVVMSLLAGFVFVGCGEESGNGNASQNIFTFNNLNRDAGGMMDAGADAGDGGTDMGPDLGDQNDAGVDMAVEPVTDPTIMSLAPAAIVEPVTTRSFMVAVNIAEAIESDARVEVSGLPEGVASSVATIRAGQTSANLTFSLTNPPPARGEATVTVTRQELGELVGTPSTATLQIALTAPVKLAADLMEFNALLAPSATQFDIVFDQPVQGVDDSTVRVFSDLRGLLAGTRDSDNSNTITFTPTDGILPDERLQVIASGLTTDFDDPMEYPVSAILTGGAGVSSGFGSALNFLASNNEVAELVRLDLDGDGDIDFATFDGDDTGAATSRLCVNGGLGNFTCNEFLPGIAVTAAAAGDFNADGLIDLIVADAGTTPTERLCINTDGTAAGMACNDAGVFTSGFATNLTVLDVNLDGLLDVVGTPATANPGGSTGERLQSCINNGGTPPQFTCSESAVTRSKLPGMHQPFDFDRDGKIDILRTSVDPARVEMCSPDTDRLYDCASLSTDPVSIGEVSAVSGGGVPFIFFASATGGQKYDVATDAQGNITLTKSAVPGLMANFERLYLTDYNGDQREDGVAIQPDGTTYVCQNGGGNPPSLTCTSVTTGISGATSADGLVADFNGDGVTDILVNSDIGGALLPGQP